MWAEVSTGINRRPILAKTWRSAAELVLEDKEDIRYTGRCNEPMPQTVCAILDDYQGVALTMADWSDVQRHADLRVFREPFADEDALVAAIADCDIVVAMRE